MSMQFQEFPDSLKHRIVSNPRFVQALERLRRGKPSTPRSWVYEDKDPKWILNTWSSILRQVCEDKGLKFISDWDLEKATKFESQGEVAPFKDRFETLSEYWAHLDTPELFSSTDWSRAIGRTINWLGFNASGKPAPIDSVISRGISEDKYNTNSGDPLLIKRKNPEAIQQARDAAVSGDWKNYFPILGSRASMGKTGKQARWIFMFPMSVNLVEQSFQQPLQDYIRKINGSKSLSNTQGSYFFTPWDGYDKVQLVLSRYCPEYEIKFGCDYTKMDQHFNWSHAEQCYKVIKHYFRPEYHSALYESLYYTFHCPVISPDGIIPGPHAMPSGSGWTNFLETIFNLILLNYALIHHRLVVPVAMGIGDDQLWLMPWNKKQFPTLDDLIRLVTGLFNLAGLSANAEKQEVSEQVASFLQRRSFQSWHPNSVQYAGVYPTVRALTSEIYPEFYHNEKEWDKNMFALRCLMIMENCVNHPAFPEFVHFIAKGNSNIVEFANSSDAEIILTRQKSKKIANFLPTYNQEKMNLNPTKFKSLIILRERS